MPNPIAPISVAPADPSHVGMGAIPYLGGVTFRVWSRFGDSVSVIGDFNAWAPGATPLAHDGTSDYWSVDVQGATVGQAYRFHIPYSADPGRVADRVDPYATSIQETAGADMKAVVTAQDTPYQVGNYSTPNWNEAVIYELHIPTFTTLPDGSHGTFESALARLPDLAALGINAIEIMPLGEFEGITSTGYNPGYIFAVEDTWGGPDAFRDFVNQAHALGIAVIVDVVYNHLAGTDLWQFDGWSRPGTCPYDSQHVDGGIYFFEDWRAHTDYSHARFDFGRPEVCQYVYDNAMRWLQQRYADGLRFDSVVNIRAVQVNGSIVADVAEGPGHPETDQSGHPRFAAVEDHHRGRPAGLRRHYPSSHLRRLRLQRAMEQQLLLFSAKCHHRCRRFRTQHSRPGCFAGRTFGKQCVPVGDLQRESRPG